MELVKRDMLCVDIFRANTPVCSPRYPDVPTENASALRAIPESSGLGFAAPRPYALGRSRPEQSARRRLLFALPCR